MAESLPEETRNWLKDILPVFEKNIVDLVQDTKSMQRVFLAIQGDPSPALSRVLSYLPIFEDQALKAKMIQRNLSNREALLARRDSNRQEVKELTQSIDALKNSSLRTDLELSQLEVKHVELERKLNNVKAPIDRRKSILVQIPDVIRQKKQELLAKVKESRTIHGSLENAFGIAEEYEHKVAEANAIRLAILKVIQDIPGL